MSTVYDVNAPGARPAGGQRRAPQWRQASIAWVAFGLVSLVAYTQELGKVGAYQLSTTLRASSAGAVNGGVAAPRNTTAVEEGTTVAVAVVIASPPPLPESVDDARRELLSLLHDAAARGQRDGGVSFPALRRCLLGEWPLGSGATTRSVDPAAPRAFASGLHCVLYHARAAVARQRALGGGSATGDSGSSGSSCYDGVPLSPPLVALLQDYTRWAMQRRAQPLGGAAAARRMRVLRYWNQATDGGLGDHVSGFVHGLATALLPHQPRAFVIDDIFMGPPHGGDNASAGGGGNLPLTAGWVPCPHARDGYDWTVPAGWQAELAPGTPLEVAGRPVPSLDEHDRGRPNKWVRLATNGRWHGDHLRVGFHSLRDWGLRRRAFFRALAATAPLVTMRSNAIEPDWDLASGHTPSDALAWRRDDTAATAWRSPDHPGGDGGEGGTALPPATESPCNGLPPELAAVLYGRPTGVACAHETLQRLRPASSPLSIDAVARGATNYSLAPGYGAPNGNLFAQLFDGLFWPSAPLMAKLAATPGLLEAYRLTGGGGEASPYVVAIHLRVGTPAPGAGYTDAPRDVLELAVPALVRCAGDAMRALVAAHGYRGRHFLWFVASDRPDAVALLRRTVEEAAAGGGDAAAAANATTAGVADALRLRLLPNGTSETAHVRVVDTGLRRVVHSGKLPPDLDAAGALDGYVDAFAEHALLSAAHAIVRSQSGFSSTAQVWGRVPVARRRRDSVFNDGRVNAAAAAQGCAGVSYHGGH